MRKGYLGVDIGSISTKGVVIDEQNHIIVSLYIWTEGNPIHAVLQLIDGIKEQLPSDISLYGIGTTGSARKLIGLLLDATVVKNEITAHGAGTLAFYPDAKTILEIGGQDSKIILLDHGMIQDYAMNTLCAAGTGAFLSSQAKRLGVDINEFGPLALNAKNAVKIAARCTVFAESDLIHKAQIGYAKEDIIAGLCRSVVLNYLNNIGKGKKIREPVIFQGGVSKNVGVVKAFEDILGMPITVDKDSHLMGAIGIAIIARIHETDKIYTLNMKEVSFETIGHECVKCPNHCEILKIYRNEDLIDTWGNKCEAGISK